MSLVLQNYLVLAFDIETSGATLNHHILALGATVVDQQYKKLDELFVPCYIENDTVFEERCMKQFWSKHMEILKTFAVEGSRVDNERKLITLFHEFRRKWEREAKKQNKELLLVSDNKIFDGGFINVLYARYMPTTLPLPYTADTQEYETFLETHSEEIGLYAGLPMGDGKRCRSKEMKFWNLSQFLFESFDSPKTIADHNPVNDAYAIACEQVTILNIHS